MHVADFCVTDTKSAIAVARALGRKYIQSKLTGKDFDDWLVNFDCSGKIGPTGMSHPRDSKTGLWVLCGCRACAELKAYLDKQQRRRRKRNALAK